MGDGGMELSDPLTMGEVEDLVDGTLVVITWSGGNGPHVYEKVSDGFDRPYAYTPGTPTAAMWFNPIQHVGVQRHQTHVQAVL